MGDWNSSCCTAKERAIQKQTKDAYKYGRVTMNEAIAQLCCIGYSTERATTVVRNWKEEFSFMKSFGNDTEGGFFVNHK